VAEKAKRSSMQILCVHILMYTYKRVLLFGPEKNMIISKRNEKKNDAWVLGVNISVDINK